MALWNYINLKMHRKLNLANSESISFHLLNEILEFNGTIKGLRLTNLLKINNIKDCTYLRNTWDVNGNFRTTFSELLLMATTEFSSGYGLCQKNNVWLLWIMETFCKCSKPWTILSKLSKFKSLLEILNEYPFPLNLQSF